MTRDDILNMPEGREMDALISKMIFETPHMELEDAGCPYCGSEMWHGKERARCSQCNEWRYSPYKDYSTDIAAAWDVADKINRMIAENILELENDYNYLTLECVGYTSGYAASFDCLLDHEWFEDITNYKYAARADTAPLAICRAALLAMVTA